jgi:hypothetical protein
MSGHYHYECDEYCENCLPVASDSPEVCSDGGEQDTPANCCVCHRPLDYSLTSEGVQYVLEYIRESLAAGPDEWNKVHDCYKGTYYEGSRHVEIVRDWAADLQNYSLDERDKKLVDFFLEVTAK